MGKLFSKANKDGALSKASKYFQSFEIGELDELVRMMSHKCVLKSPASIVHDEKNSTHFFVPTCTFPQFEQLTKEAASHGHGKTGIDKQTFSDYFPYPGVLRDQIFGVFDVDGPS